jgi:hypothetical protein
VAISIRTRVGSPFVAPCAGVQVSQGLFGRARQVFPTEGGVESPPGARYNSAAESRVPRLPSHHATTNVTLANPVGNSPGEDGLTHAS